MSSPTPPSLSVFSWNVLSQFNLGNALRNASDWRYRDEPPEAGEWSSHRLASTLQVLEAAASEADVLVLQEVDCDVFVRDLRPRLREWGWEVVHQWDEGDVELGSPPHPWGVATAFRGDRWVPVFRETRSRALVLGLQEKKPDVPNPNEVSIPDEAVSAAYTTTTAGDTKKKGGKKANGPIPPPTASVDWFVINVHLSADSEKTAERLRQLESTLWKMSLHSKVDPARARVIVTGDFNSVMSDSPFQYLLRGSFKDEETDQAIQHAFRFVNAYRDDDERPTYFDPRVRERVDHLCFTGDTAQCVSVLGIPVGEGAPAPGRGLYGMDFPSDHFPVGGKFVALALPEPQKPRDPNECPLTPGQMRVLEFLEAGAPVTKKKKGKPTEKELAALKAHSESLTLFMTHLTPDQKAWVKTWRKNFQAGQGGGGLIRRLSKRLSFSGVGGGGGFGIAEMFQNADKTQQAKTVTFQQEQESGGGLPPRPPARRRQTITFGKAKSTSNVFDPALPLPDIKAVGGGKKKEEKAGSGAPAGAPQADVTRRPSLLRRLSQAVAKAPGHDVKKNDLDLV